MSTSASTIVGRRPFDARWDRQRPFNRYVYSSTVSGRGTSTVTDGYDRAFYGMRRMYHLASVYDFETAITINCGSIWISQ